MLKHYLQKTMRHLFETDLKRTFPKLERISRFLLKRLKEQDDVNHSVSRWISKATIELLDNSQKIDDVESQLAAILEFLQEQGITLHPKLTIIKGGKSDNETTDN